MDDLKDITKKALVEIDKHGNPDIYKYEGQFKSLLSDVLGTMGVSGGVANTIRTMLTVAMFPMDAIKHFDMTDDLATISLTIGNLTRGLESFGFSHGTSDEIIHAIAEHKFLRHFKYKSFIPTPPEEETLPLRSAIYHELEWSGTRMYRVGDMVIYQGDAYSCTSPGIVGEPGVDCKSWVKVGKMILDPEDLISEDTISTVEDALNNLKDQPSEIGDINAFSKFVSIPNYFAGDPYNYILGVKNHRKLIYDPKHVGDNNDCIAKDLKEVILSAEIMNDVHNLPQTHDLIDYLIMYLAHQGWGTDELSVHIQIQHDIVTGGLMTWVEFRNWPLAVSTTERPCKSTLVKIHIDRWEIDKALRKHA